MFSEKSKLPSKPNLPPFRSLTNQTLSIIQTNEEQVNKILKGLDISKANGPDGISNRMLKSTADAIAKPLTNLFNWSLATGKFPSEWK